MRKSFLFILSLVILLSSLLTVVASAENFTFEDDMFDDDVNVTYDAGTTATTSGSFLGALGGLDDGVGGFIGGVVESVFQDNDVSQQVGDKVDGVLGVFEGFDLGSLIPSTNAQTTGSNFFDTIDPVVTGSYTSNYNQNTTASTPITSLNGESVNYNTTVNPYSKPTAALNPGDKSDGVKWLQWILIYTECGLQGTITGEYDDATAAAVKNLQLKYGLTVDGIASLEVIEKADQMYNDYISGVTPQNSSSPAVFNTVGSANTSQGGKADKGVNVKVTVIIVVLIIVWIFAIAAVFVIIHIKRKNITPSEDGGIVKTEKEKKEKKVKQNKKSKNKGSKRANGTLRDYEPLRESKTLQSLEDDVDIDADADVFQDETNDFEDDFEVVDIEDNFNEFDEDEITLSSLSEVKKKRAEQAKRTNK